MSKIYRNWFAITILMVGCSITKEPAVNSPIPMENYDEDVLRAKAKDLNMRLVDYLHALSNGKIADLRKQPFILYQAYDENWSDDPSINPVFATKVEADKYAKENNMGSNHSYKVREVAHRYEVRRVNDVDNDLLYTCRTHNEAYEYGRLALIELFSNFASNYGFNDIVRALKSADGYQSY